MKNDLTAEYVRSILDYSPETGIFTWKHRPEGYAPWNARYAGTIASTVNCYGYSIISIAGKKYHASRLAFLIMTGSFPPHEMDHRDCNALNNKWKNLREATPSQNQHNKRIYKNNTSGHKGIVWDKANNKWFARVVHCSKVINIGRFQSIGEAISERNKKILELHGEFARAA